jgi:hypothetical protein
VAKAHQFLVFTVPSALQVGGEPHALVCMWRGVKVDGDGDSGQGPFARDVALAPAPAEA